jgi:hypothetical protein
MYLQLNLMCRRYQRPFHEILSFPDNDVAAHNNYLFTLSIQTTCPAH